MLSSAKGHVMISYNWGNQPIVLRLAKTLQERGYDVWLDVERMGGSTLEASILIRRRRINKRQYIIINMQYIQIQLISSIRKVKIKTPKKSR